MTELVFFLEEASAKAMLEVLVPRLAPPGAPFHLRCVVFEGKQDLERNLERKLRGYLTPNAKFFVLRDQDREDCRKLKQRLNLSHGFDGDVEPARDRKPHELSVARSTKVPGACAPLGNLFHASQALSWIAGTRNTIPEQLEHVKAIPRLMKPLTEAAV